ncbi:MAG: hypothetical protein KDD04_00040 [Sinomicrobium sp.]|nr:hypothetical protein [Sinomicrobium sp.]
MKKLILMLPLAAWIMTFAVACTAPVTDEDHETNIQLIDKEQTHSPLDKKKNQA